MKKNCVIKTFDLLIVDLYVFVLKLLPELGCSQMFEKCLPQTHRFTHTHTLEIKWGIANTTVYQNFFEWLSLNSVVFWQWTSYYKLSSCKTTFLHFIHLLRGYGKSCTLNLSRIMVDGWWLMAGLIEKDNNAQAQCGRAWQ